MAHVYATRVAHGGMKDDPRSPALKREMRASNQLEATPHSIDLRHTPLAHSPQQLPIVGDYPDCGGMMLNFNQQACTVLGCTKMIHVLPQHYEYGILTVRY